MACCFAVPTKCDTMRKTQLLCKLKNVMMCLEEELNPKAEPSCYTPVCVTSGIPCCPPCCQGEESDKECGGCEPNPCPSPCCPPQPCCPSQPCCPPLLPCCPPPCCPPCCCTPDVMVCYKRKCDSKKRKTHKRGASSGKELGPSKSRELRAGILHIGCHCEKRNGLQDNCLRTGCQGAPACLTRPPTCLNSRYCNGKHLMKKMKDRQKQKTGEEEEEEESEDEKYVYDCYCASVKAPDQKICIMMPTVECPKPCCRPCCGSCCQPKCCGSC